MTACLWICRTPLTDDLAYTVVALVLTEPQNESQLVQLLVLPKVWLGQVGLEQQPSLLACDANDYWVSMSYQIHHIQLGLFDKRDKTNPLPQKVLSDLCWNKKKNEIL